MTNFVHKNTVPTMLMCASLSIASSLSVAAPLSLPESPLFVSGFVDPNIIFLIDNSGSMSNIVPDAPYDPVVTTTSCPASKVINPVGISRIDIRITSSGDPYFVVVQPGADPVYDWGSTGSTGITNRTVKCFDPALNYLARLYGGGGNNGGTKSPSGYLQAQYTGNFLNWYFGSAPTNWGTDTRNRPGTERRMDIAKAASTTLVNSLNNTRIGLASYNVSSGATINVGIDDVGINRASMLSGINALTPSGSTPLAESLHGIGRYFVGESGTQNNGGPNGQYNGNLILHPGQSNQLSRDDDAVFNRSPNYASGVSSASPITAFCQKNFAVLLTDGRPQSDQDITPATGLQDYDGDCDSSSSTYNGTACLSNDRKAAQQYESSGTDFLDDVAKALYEIDLRPDMDDFNGDEVINNIITHTIGFADDQVINDPLMKDTAANGGGLFLQAANAADLASAFAEATAEIFSKVGSAAAVGATSGSVRAESRIYQGRFNSGNWTGQLLSIPINQDGTLDPVEWDAAVRLTDAFALSSREIITLNTTASPNPVGIPFRWANLNATQKAAMNTKPDGTSDIAGSEEGESRTNYIRGLRTNEAPNGNGYRTRISLLGDLMNSEPIYVGAPPFNYPDDIEGNSGQTYTTFKRSSVKNRTPVVYVGANDGMLHGFDASVDAVSKGPTATSGQEVIAYIPNKIIPKLTSLTDPGYTHRMYVDGSALAGDIYLNSGNWATILVGALGRGGQGLYALNITDPGQFSESNAAATVLWEYTDADSSDLGFIYGASTIVRMHPVNNGSWAVVTGNGYNNTEADGNTSTSGNAALFIINAETGTLIKKIDTGVGTSADPNGTGRPNGLAPPAPVDVDGDNVVDYVYAGDLYGNLWKFDVRSNTSSAWTVTKLFTAVAANGDSQPITSQVTVSRHLTESGFMIYFGTGKYLEPADTNPSGATTQTFYAIWDEETNTLVTRSDLYSQQILAEITNPFNSNEALRITSDNAGIDWNTNHGWKMDLLNTQNGNTNNFGERAVTDPVFLPPSRDFPSGRIIFTTLIPDDRQCGFGGTGWFMEVDANDGSALGDPPFDINVSGTVDISDTVTFENIAATIVSGKKDLGPDAGIPSKPKIVEGTQGTFKYTSNSSGSISTTTEPAPFTGRTSWRELSQ